MPIRTPPQDWRERIARETRRFEAGEIAEEERYALRLYPAAFLDRVDALLAEYVRAIEACAANAAGHAEATRAIRAAVLGLNQANTSYGHRVIATAEREELCEFLDAVIIARGIDIDALAASQNVDRWELTDEWREW